MSVASQFAYVERTRRVAAKAEARRSLTRVRSPDPGPLLDFVPKLSPKWQRPDHLAPLAEAFERGVREGGVRVAFSVPVRHGKTSLLVSAVPWLLRKDPSRSILYVSYAHGFARKQTARSMTLAVRAGLGLGGSRRKDEWQTLAGGQVKAAGIGGQITGEGFTDIIIDDPHKNRAEAESRIIREATIEALEDDIFTRDDPRGTNVYLVHARWHVNDAIGVFSRSEHQGFAYHNLPALDGEGRALAPWLWSADFLRQKELQVGPYTWASLYQGSPRPRGGALFIDVTLVERLPEIPHRVAIGIDLAFTAKTRSDRNAAVVMRRHMGAKPAVYDIPEAVAERGLIADRRRERDGEVVDPGFVRQLAPLVKRYPSAPIVMYAHEREAGIIASIERELESVLGGTRVRVKRMSIENRDKWVRSSEGYAPVWNDGRVLIQRPANRDGWQNGFVAQHVSFSGVRGDEDDLVDAATAAFDFLDGMNPGGGGRPQTSGEGSEADRGGRYL